MITLSAMMKMKSRSKEQSRTHLMYCSKKNHLAVSRRRVCLGNLDSMSPSRSSEGNLGECGSFSSSGRVGIG